MSSKLRFGQAGIQLGLLTQEQVDEALAVQKELKASGQKTKLIGVILVELGHLKGGDVVRILEAMEDQG